MKNKASLIFTILLSVVMLGVLFGVMTNSRNSILIKEVIFVTGGSLAALFAAVLLIKGVPSYSNRVSKLSVFALLLIIILMFLRHFFGVSSVNGPFTIYTSLSLAALVVSSLLYMQLRHVRVFISILLGASLVVFVYAILQWQGVNVFAWDAALTRSGRSTGSMGNPNLLGGFASALIPLGIAYIVSLKKLSGVFKYLLVAGFICFAIFAVIASGTRGSIIGVFSGTLFFLLWYVKKSEMSLKRNIIFILGFIFVTLFVVLPMSGRLAELDSTAENQGTLQVRKIIWSGAYEIFTRSPVWGHGPGSFQILFPEVRNPSYSLLGVSHNTLHAHCEYLEILVDIGLIGLILWGVLFFGLIPKLKQASLIQMAAFSGVVAMLAEALVSVHLRWPPTAWLFAMLLLISLIKKDVSSKSNLWFKASALLFLIGGLVLAMGLFTHYIPLLRSSQLVFKGKDIYLAKTEMAMNSAYSAANQWNNTHDETSLNTALNAWYGASMYADSAVYYSEAAVNTFPENLGAWYALGSAHLTRYMVMSPPVPAMQNVLNFDGTFPVYSQSELHDELNAGMAAYDTLVTLAPNYAEVHNNLALGYSNKGNIDESMRELYYSYLIHGHRRDDYFSQVSALLSIYPNSVEGAQLYFLHILLTAEFSDERKLSQTQDAIFHRAWFLVAAQPENRDTLETAFISLINQHVVEGFRADLISGIERIDEHSPYISWFSGEIIINSYAETLEEFLKMYRLSTYQSSTFSVVLPDNSEFYTHPFLVMVESGWNENLYDLILDIFLAQIQIDRQLDDAHSLVYSQRFRSVVDPAVAEKIASVRYALGGSRTALREGIPMPWLDGSLPAMISDSLHNKMAIDSLNSKWYKMELELTFLLVTSYWWDFNVFASEQNQYLLERIFYCRDALVSIEPNNWQRLVSQILDKEINRISHLTNGACPTTIGLLRDDLVNGSPRNYN